MPWTNGTTPEIVAAGEAKDRAYTPQNGTPYGANKPGRDAPGFAFYARDTYRAYDPQVDANAFLYGGQAGGAQAAQDRYSQMGQGYANQAAPKMDMSAYNRGSTYSDYARAAQMAALESQNDVISSYKESMAGQTPSLAQQQMRQGLAASQQAAASQAASARGGGANLAAAQRAGAQQQATLGAAGVGQAAQLRAQEFAQAQQGYGQAVGQFGQFAAQNRASELQQMGLSADQAYRQAQLEAGQRSLGAGTQLSYEQMGQRAQQDQLEAYMRQQQLQSQNSLQVQDINARLNEADTKRQQEAAGGLSSAAGAAVGALAMFSDERLKKNVEQSDPIQDSKQAAASESQQRTSAIGAAISKIGGGGDGEDSSVGGGFASGLTGMMGKGGGGGMLSDEEEKRGIESVMGHLSPKTYEYKHPEVDGYGRRVGIMAQDLEKSEMGRDAIIDTPRGMAVDYNKGLSLSLAAVADLHDRLSKLEGRYAAKKGK